MVETAEEKREKTLENELQNLLNEAIEHIYIHFDSKSMDDIFFDEKIAFAKGAVIETVKQNFTKTKTFTERTP